MSAVIVLTPILISAWPMLAAAVTSAAVSAGFRMEKAAKETPKLTTVDLTMENMGVVAETLGRDQEVSVERDGVRVTFSRDMQGHFQTRVAGNLAKEQLEQIGHDLAGRVIQQYVYRRISAELANQGFETLEEDQAENQTIHLHVRRYPV